MRLVATIVFLAGLLTSCSSTKRIATNRPDRYRGTADEVHNEILGNNIGSKDFTVNRFRINYSDKELDKNVSGFIKHEKNGNVLISVRTVAGIEIARALITGDSLKVYDKINRILYLQSIEYLARKYGYPESFVALLWGDMPSSGVSAISNVKPDEESGDLLKYLSEDYNYFISRENLKVTRLQDTGSAYDSYIEYSGFRQTGKEIYPTEILLVSERYGQRIEVSYSSIRFDKVKNMSFSPTGIKEYIVLK